MAETTANEIQNEITTTSTGVMARTGSAISELRRMASQPAVQRALPSTAAILLACVGLIAYLILQQPSRTTLYASLPESEKSKILDALTNAGIDAPIDPTTGDVMVPVTDYHESKMKLAAQGLPSSVPGGYDPLGEILFGTSRSV